MTKWRLAITGLILLLLLTSGISCLNASVWRLKCESLVRDATHLISQYAQRRIKDGKWPDPKETYVIYFHHRRSLERDGKRVDVFSADADGAESAWLSIELGGDGTIAARMDFHEPQ